MRKALKMLKAVRVRANKRNLFVEFDDGNQVLLPWELSRALSHATDEQRADVRIEGNGLILSWPVLGEDVPVRDLAWRE